jgi:hypothetical protein
MTSPTQDMRYTQNVVPQHAEGWRELSEKGREGEAAGAWCRCAPADSAWRRYCYWSSRRPLFARIRREGTRPTVYHTTFRTMQWEEAYSRWCWIWGDGAPGSWMMHGQGTYWNIGRVDDFHGSVCYARLHQQLQNCIFPVQLYCNIYMLVALHIADDQLYILLVTLLTPRSHSCAAHKRKLKIRPRNKRGRAIPRPDTNLVEVFLSFFLHAVRVRLFSVGS